VLPRFSKCEFALNSIVVSGGIIRQSLVETIRLTGSNLDIFADKPTHFRKGFSNAEFDGRAHDRLRILH